MQQLPRKPPPTEADLAAVVRVVATRARAQGMTPEAAVDYLFARFFTPKNPAHDQTWDRITAKCAAAGGDVVSLFPLIDCPGFFTPAERLELRLFQLICCLAEAAGFDELLM